MATTPPPAQFTTPLTFRPQDAGKKAASQLACMSCLFLLLGLCLLFLIGVLWGWLKVPGGRWSLLVTVVLITAGLAVWRYYLLKKHFERTSITVSPFGVVLDDGDAVTTLAWHDMRDLQNIKPWRAAGTRPLAGTVATKTLTQAASEGTRALLAGLGIVGPGQLEITATNPLKRAGMEQERNRCGVDPDTGQPYVGVTPGIVLPDDTPWTRSQFGEWLRYYRPDIWALADERLANGPASVGGAG